MTIPTLPTDNLYKFIALTGIIICVISTLYFEINRQELNEGITIIKGEIEKHDYERLSLVDQDKKLKKKINELNKLCNCGTPSIVTDSLIVRPLIEDGPKHLVELSNQIDILLDERNSIIKEISLKAIEINTKNALIKNKQDELSELNDVLTFSLPLSALFSGLGFGLWFYKTQVLQDDILKSQYEQNYKTERCQSCGIRLKDDNEYLKLDSDKQKMTLYCSTCFKDGQFTEEMTLVEMQNKIKNRCKELGLNRVDTFLHLKGLKNLRRWRTKFKWS